MELATDNTYCLEQAVLDSSNQNVREFISRIEINRFPSEWLWMVLSISSRRLTKVAVAIGGFLILVGATIIGILTLVLTRIIDVSALEGMLESVNYRILFLEVLLAIGVLDVISGIILRHR